MKLINTRVAQLFRTTAPQFLSTEHELRFAAELFNMERLSMGIGPFRSISCIIRTSFRRPHPLLPAQLIMIFDPCEYQTGICLSSCRFKIQAGKVIPNKTLQEFLSRLRVNYRPVNLCLLPSIFSYIL